MGLNFPFAQVLINGLLKSKSCGKTPGVYIQSGCGERDEASRTICGSMSVAIGQRGICKHACIG